MSDTKALITDMTTKKFIEGSDVQIYSRTDGDTDTLIGLVQSISVQDARGLPQVGEVGSDETITLISPSQKSAQLGRIMVNSRSLLSSFYFSTTAVTSDNYSPEILVGGDTIKIFARKHSSAELDDLFDDGNIVGLVQQYNISSNLPVSQIGEIGGEKKYLLSNKADKSISLNRIVSESSNVLRAFYSDYVVAGASLGDIPRGRIWTDLDHGLFKKPIDIGIQINKGEDTLHEIVLGSALPQSVSGAIQQGTRGIADAISFKWNKTTYLTASADDDDDENVTNPMLIDLDNKFCREPFDIVLKYTFNADGDDVIEEHHLKNCLVTSISHAVSHGSRSTVESAQLMWEETDPATTVEANPDLQ